MWSMLREVVAEAFAALRRNRTRSSLTMLGIVWGIVSVTLLIAYGNGFRSVLVTAFEAFGKSAIVCWPQQTSEQPGTPQGRANKHRPHPSARPGDSDPRTPRWTNAPPVRPGRTKTCATLRGRSRRSMTACTQRCSKRWRATERST